MPHKLKSLSGGELAKFFGRLGFVMHNIEGSHIKMRRRINETIQTLIIPRHKPVQKGTLKSLYNQAKRFIDVNDLDDFFYTK
jgi:predicted RNA binding protein YcfA (HicA-like mRNA interferase family)